MSPSRNRNRNNSTSTSTASSIGSSTVSSKKLKTMSTDDEFEIVKNYLMQCPHVSSVRDSPAIKAAIEGIEKEQQRRVRDAKLQSKFGDKRSVASAVTTSGSLNDADEIVVVEKVDIGVTNTTSASIVIDAPTASNDDMEWQDVPQKSHDSEDTMTSSGSAIGGPFSMEERESSSDGNCCFLGRALAKECIDAIVIAEQQQRSPVVVVSTPVAAIALALHAALRSDVLGFACTGVPEDKSSSSKKGGGGLGFAPPVREMSKTDFLPHGWDDEKEKGKPMSLRYRKIDTGAVVLTVEEKSSGDDDNNDDNNGAAVDCQVTFVPTNNKESTAAPGCHTSLRFPLSEHINLDSWNAATLKAVKARKSSNNKIKIAPSLHYKNLSGLLSKFCRTFDLGAVNNSTADDEADQTTMPAAMMGTKINTDATAFVDNNNNNNIAVVSSLNTNDHPIAKSITDTESREEGFSVPSTLDQAFPSAAARRNDPTMMHMNYPPHGDFDDDLFPASGLQDPRFGRVGAGRIGGGTGNLMGPNHPMFSSGGGGHGQMMGGFAFGGPGTMQPRYDPVLPPGIGGGDDIPSTGPPLGRGGPAGRPPQNKNPKTRTGEPNPDHLPPPNSLGNNMFM